MAVFYPKCSATLQVVFDGFAGDDSKPTVIDVWPISATVSMNGYTQADTFSLTFDAKRTPFSPELIRMMQVDLFIYDAGKAIESPDEAKANRKTSNRVIVGLIDEGSISFSSDGLTFSVSGRDFTALLLDKPCNPKVRIPLDKPIDEVVQLMADIASGVKTVTDTGQVAPTGHKQVLKVRVVDSLGSLPLANSGKAKSKQKGMSLDASQNYWDAVYQLVQSHGLIAYVTGYEIVIDSPHVLDAVSRTLAPNVAYGRNLESLHISRKTAREAVPQIRAVSYDRVTRKQVVALFPEKAKERTVPGINFKRSEQITVTVPGVTDQAKLKAIAESRYHAMGRSESTVEFATRDMTDLDGASLLYLKPGDAVKVAFDDLHLEEFKSINSAQQRASIAKKYGYTDQVAKLIGRSFDNVIREGQPLYTRTVDLAFDLETGLSLKVAAQNFISTQRSTS